MKQEVIVL